VGVPSVAPAPPAATQLDALDQLLEHTYADAFARLDLQMLLQRPDDLRLLLGPFTTPKESQCRQP
jgi:hypothetical protein